MTRRNVFIADKIWQKLKNYADVRGLKTSEVIRRALNEFLEREENK